MPTRFIRFDPVDIGSAWFSGRYYPGSGQGGVLLKASCQWDRFRLGVAYLEMWGDIADGPAGPVPVEMQLPVYAGFDIWHNPKKTWLFYGAVPDIYAEVGISLRDPKVMKAALACDVDYYGFGLMVEGGGYLNPGNGNTFYAGVLLRFLTFGIGF